MPRNNPISKILGTALLPIKCPALLNIKPPSFAKMVAFSPACTIKKRIKKIPVNPITNFFPTEEVNICLNVIVDEFKNLRKNTTQIDRFRSMLFIFKTIDKNLLQTAHRPIGWFSLFINRPSII
jgi:hypothetical protein